MERSIPLLDLRDFTGDDRQKKMLVVADLYKAFTEVGFVCIEGHGIPDALVDEFYQLSKQFFSFPPEGKTRYEVEGLAGQRGYASFGKEHAKQVKVGDLKEFFQIGQTVVGKMRSEVNTRRIML
ncbi:MAG: 2-oxoglutarate and iron-dependent oxygenase domain-containing protein [Saprospiraceae bacterium]